MFVFLRNGKPITTPGAGRGYHWCGLLLLALLLTALQSLYAQCFTNRQDYGVGSRPRDLALGDVNADGRLDIVTANVVAGTVTVLVAQAGGGYASTDYGVGDQPYSVALGDVNADGRLDIVAANYDGNLTVLLAQAGGGYARTSYGVGYYPNGLALGDVNADGRLDIVTTSISGNSVTVLVAQAGGGYARSDYGVGNQPYGLALGDVNADGRLDIVTANYNGNSVTVLVAQAAGGYARSDYGLGNGPIYSVALGDVNVDGRLDIVTTSGDDALVTVLVAQAGGGYARSDYGVSNYPISLALGDVNVDGRLDIVTANSNINGKYSVTVLVAQAGGGYARSDYGLGDIPYSLALGDVNADGRLDIVTANYNGNSVTVLLNALPVGITRQPTSSSIACAGATVTASVSTSGTVTGYQWYKDGSLLSGQTSATLTLPNTTTASSGSYQLAVTGSCNSLTSTAFDLTVQKPSVSISPSTTAICAGQSTTLSASGADSYRWSMNQTTSSINVSATGTYSVTGITSAGCSATASASVTVNPLPTISLTNNGPITCALTSVTLIASGGLSYVFSGPGLNQTSALATARAVQPGTYSVTVTDANGCSATAQTPVGSDLAPPTNPTLTGGTLSCTQTSLTLTASATGGLSYTFSAGTPLGANQTVVTQAGTYSVVITGANGCTATANTTISSNTLVPTATLGGSGNLTCTNRTVTLTAGGGGTYAFSSGASQINGGNTATVTAEGLYSVTVTNPANGCTAIQSTQVTSNTTAPAATLNNNGPITANQPTVTLTAGGGNTYAFSSSSTQQNGGNTATVTTPGNYQVTVTGTNGCSATASTIVTGAVSSSSCRNGTGVITVVASGTPVKYEWYRNSINSARLTENPAQVRGTSTSSLTLVNQQVTADYYVRVTDANGSAVVYGPFRMAVNLGCNVYARQGAEVVELRISLLGNPVQGDQLKAVISGAEGKALNVQLLDLQGRAVHQQQWQQADQEHSVEWNLGGQSSGIYLLQATTPDQRQRVKVVKQ